LDNVNPKPGITQTYGSTRQKLVFIIKLIQQKLANILWNIYKKKGRGSTGIRMRGGVHQLQ
jgi:hypothetical protein